MSESGSITSIKLSMLEDFNPETAERLGEGTYGIVYKGYLKPKTTGVRRWPRTPVAIKVLRSVPTDIEKQKDFIREADTASKFRFPSLMHVLTHSCTHERWMIVSLCAKGSLDKAIDQEARGVSLEWQTTAGQEVRWNSTKKAISVFGIAAGLCFMHEKEKKIIHRDIKPANVLLDENMHPLITDFGLSRVLSANDAQMTGNVGTPLYMAPEVFDGEQYDEKVDVYSYGMLVYELISLHRPFYDVADLDKGGYVRLGQLVRSGRRPTLDGVPPEWQDLIVQCWHQEPAKRPTMRDVVERLKAMDFSAMDEDLDINEFQEYRDMVYEKLPPRK